MYLLLDNYNSYLKESMDQQKISTHNANFTSLANLFQIMKQSDSRLEIIVGSYAMEHYLELLAEVATLAHNFFYIVTLISPDSAVAKRAELDALMFDSIYYDASSVTLPATLSARLRYMSKIIDTPVYPIINSSAAYEDLEYDLAKVQFDGCIYTGEFPKYSEGPTDSWDAPFPILSFEKLFDLKEPIILPNWRIFDEADKVLKWM